MSAIERERLRRETLSAAVRGTVEEFQPASSRNQDGPYELRPPKPPQTIRGGHIALRRDGKKHRLTLIGGRPYEHGSLDEVMAQATVLANRFGSEIAVFAQVATVLPNMQEISPPPPIAPPPAVASPAKRPVIVERRTKRTSITPTAAKGGLR